MVVIDKDGRFLHRVGTKGFRFVAEYPDAEKFRTLRMARWFAARARGAVVVNYGMSGLERIEKRGEVSP